MRSELIPILAACMVIAGCGDSAPTGFSGYMEGEYVRVAAPFAGELTLLQVKPQRTMIGGRWVVEAGHHFAEEAVAARFRGTPVETVALPDVGALAERLGRWIGGGQ